jgi:hypothetical protein
VRNTRLETSVENRIFFMFFSMFLLLYFDKVRAGVRTDARQISIVKARGFSDE